MSKIKKSSFILFSLLIAIVCGFAYCLPTFINSKLNAQQATNATRTIEVKQNEIDFQSVFDQFENTTLETNDNITTFEGTKTFNLLDFCEADLVSELDADTIAEIQIKYHYDYDSEANVITLTATLLDEEGNLVIDTMSGVPFVDENGNLDCVFDCDGEYILLSELQDAGMIENCGWFKKLCKKVSTAVKKVTSTVVGKIGAVATIAVPAVIGVVCAVAAAPVVATVAVGALVGAGIAAGTAAISTYQQDGKVDWETVGICAGVGGAVGALASGVAYGITNAITGGAGVTNQGFESFDKLKNHLGDPGEGKAWHHIVEQCQIDKSGFASTQVNNVNNIISIPHGSGSVHAQISGYYSSIKPFTNGQTVRAWLSGQSFEAQFKFGMDLLKQFGNVTVSNGVWVFLPF